jgi:hypothetical protein
VWCEHPKKFIMEVLLPIVNFTRYKTLDNVAIREFYLLLSTAIIGAKNVHLLKMLVNEQSLTTIMVSVRYHSGGSMKLNSRFLLFAHMVYL